MRLFRTLLVALALTGTFFVPVGAADRPVGPETGQARTNVDQEGFTAGPDDGDPFNGFGLSEQGDLGLSWGEFWCRVIYVWGGDTSGSRC